MAKHNWIEEFRSPEKLILACASCDNADCVIKKVITPTETFFFRTGTFGNYYVYSRCETSKRMLRLLTGEDDAQVNTLLRHE